MKKIHIFFMLSLMIHMGISAQDYQNIITNGSAFYSSITDSAGFLSGIKIESRSSLGNGDTLFLAVNTIRPHNHDVLLDTIGGFLGRRIVKMNSGWFYFFNAAGDTLFLNSNASLNSTWKFCNLPFKGQLTATCTSIQALLVLGAIDTVKEITFHAKDSNGVSISNFYNDKSILLGKKYGLITTYDFYHFPDSTAVFTIEGKNNPVIGFQGLTWRDIYDYDVGDEFHYASYYKAGGFPHLSYDEYQTIMKVLTKEVPTGGATVTYTFEHCNRHYHYDLPPYTNYTFDTIEVSYPYNSSLDTSTINWFPEQFTTTGYRYFSALHHRIPGRPAYGQAGNYYSCCWQDNPEYPEQMTDDREFTKGLGQVHYENYWYLGFYGYDFNNLVYYKKGSETWGTPLSADCSSMIPSLTFYPDTLVMGWHAGSSDTLHIISDTTWSIHFWQGDPLVCSPQNGFGNRSVLVTVTQDTYDYSDKLMDFFIDYPGGSKVVLVKQLGEPLPSLQINPDTLFLGPGIDSKDTLFFHSNVKTITSLSGDCDWADYNPTSIWDSIGSFIFTTIAANPDSSVRMSNFSLHSDWVDPKPFIVCQSTKVLGIKNNIPLKVTIAPNPIQTTAILSFSRIVKFPEKQLTLYDFMGRLVFEDSFTSEKYLFKRDKLPPGMYCLKVIYDKDSPAAIVKVVLE